MFSLFKLYTLILKCMCERGRILYHPYYVAMRSLPVAAKYFIGIGLKIPLMKVYVYEVMSDLSRLASHISFTWFG